MQSRELTLEQNHMATTFAFTVACAENLVSRADSVLLECHKEMEKIEAELSEFRVSSPVSLLNAAKAREEILTTPHLTAMLLEAERMKKQTGGAFDHLAKSTGPGDIIFTPDRNKIYKSTSGVKLSFGAIGKGYALDCARLLIERESFTDYFLNAGGSSLLFSGFGAGGNPWPWAWAWNKQQSGFSGKKFEHKSGKRLALGVSGLMEQGEHILHPLENKKANTNLSALVAHELASRADALSTALFVKGWKDLESYEDPQYLSAMALVDGEDRVKWNGSFQAQWGGAC